MSLTEEQDIILLIRNYINILDPINHERASFPWVGLNYLLCAKSDQLGQPFHHGDTIIMVQRKIAE